MCLEYKDFSIMPWWKWKLNLSVIYQNCLPWTLTTMTSILCPFTVPSHCWFSHSVNHCLILIYSSVCSFLTCAKVRHVSKLNILLNFCCTLLRYSQLLLSLPICFSFDGSASMLHVHCPAYLPHVVVQLLSHVQFFATPMTVAHQASLSMGFSKQEYWSGLWFPSPGNLLDPGIKPASPALASRFFTTETLEKPLCAS